MEGSGTGVRMNPRSIPLSDPLPTIWPLLLIAKASERYQPAPSKMSAFRFIATAFSQMVAHAPPPTTCPLSFMP